MLLMRKIKFFQNDYKTHKNIWKRVKKKQCLENENVNLRQNNEQSQKPMMEMLNDWFP